MPGPAPERLRFVVAPGEDGERLDRVLAARLPGESRSRLARLAREGRARVDGRPAKPAQVMRAGQAVALEIPAPEPPDLEPEDIPLDIPYEDEDLAVVDKPPGLVVHPAAGNPRHTLVHALLHHLGDLAGIGGRLRPGIVHRLDKDTSGLLVVAKSDRAHRRLAEMMAAHEVRREYLALVRGRLPAAEGLVDAPVGRHPVHRKKMAVVAAGGRPAQTRYVRMDTFAGFDYIRVELRTGRTHQIRVHMAHLGHPVLGDPVYGGRGRPPHGAGRRVIETHRRLLALMRRQALHAWRLRFAHPLSGAAMEFTAPLPPDMQAALDCLRQLRAEELSE